MARGKLDVGLEIEKFAVEMIKNFNSSVGKGGWKGNDKWWYLSQLAIAVRELESAMVKHSEDITKKSCNVANIAMIISDLCVVDKPRKKRKIKSKKRITKKV